MGEDYATAYRRANQVLERFKARHPEAEGESTIPLVRLGADEAGENRTVNSTAWGLLGYLRVEAAKGLMRVAAGRQHS